MSTHKNIDRVCVAALLLSLVLALLFLNGEALGLASASTVMGYETRLFDATRVHTIDLVIDDWEAFLDTCENEEYSPCSVVIDNEGVKNVGLRAKGNTSLSTVSSLGSDRYSFKLEFDQYDSGKTYHGLDKLCLNNLIQDNTFLKDYLTYQMMAQFGAPAPLCSFAFLTVNGEDWGLYLAVEGIEDGFLRRNYGTQHGALYKPDSMSFGGGRGNGRAFVMENLDGSDPASFSLPEPPDDLQRQDDAPPAIQQHGGRWDNNSGEKRGIGGGFGGGMGSDDVKLKYTGDDPDCYVNIFDSAKTDASEADQTRLIQALKALGQGDVGRSVNLDAVLRYFVVHNFVVNGDSYTGSMVHNYYLYEENGLLSMIPWDYNLAFGTFQGNNASSAVNDPIDTPLSVTGSGDRPMADWIPSSEEYTALYHQYFAQFLETVDPAVLIDEAYALIAPYVERDPTKFCTYEQFQTGVEALKTFCALRVESVSGQLTGTISSTREGQDQSALVDASGLTLSDMGTMNQGGGPGANPQDGFDRPNRLPQGEDAAAFHPEASRGGRPEDMRLPGGGLGEDLPEAAAVSGGAAPALLAVSVLVLVLGLLAARMFKRFGR